MDQDPRQHHLEQLRRWRVRPEPDLSLAFLREDFKKNIEKPHKQLAAVAQAWVELVPEALRIHTRLEGLSRGVLNVAVDSSARLYELDRLLRQGLQRDLLQRNKGPAIRRVQLRLQSPVEPRSRRRPDPNA